MCFSLWFTNTIPPFEKKGSIGVPFCLNGGSKIFFSTIRIPTPRVQFWSPPENAFTVTVGCFFGVVKKGGLRKPKPHKDFGTCHMPELWHSLPR